MVYRLRAIPVLRSGAWPRGCRAPQLFAGGLLPAGRRLAAGAVLAALVLLAASVPASAQALTWSVVPSPSPGSGSGLAGVLLRVGGRLHRCGPRRWQQRRYSHPYRVLERHQVVGGVPSQPCGR